jgi:hypothetical protein
MKFQQRDGLCLFPTLWPVVAVQSPQSAHPPAQLDEGARRNTQHRASTAQLDHPMMGRGRSKARVFSGTKLTRCSFEQDKNGFFNPSTGKTHNKHKFLGWRARVPHHHQAYHYVWHTYLRFHRLSNRCECQRKIRQWTQEALADCLSKFHAMSLPMQC